MFHPSRRLALALAALAFVFLAATSPAIPLVWDEGEYLGRATQLVLWLKLIAAFRSPDGGLHAFSARVIHDHWIAISWYEGHPGWALVPMAVMKGLFGRVLAELTAARLGTILIVAAACNAVAF